MDVSYIVAHNFRFMSIIFHSNVGTTGKYTLIK